MKNLTNKLAKGIFYSGMVLSSLLSKAQDLDSIFVKRQTYCLGISTLHTNDEKLNRQGYEFIPGINFSFGNKITSKTETRFSAGINYKSNSSSNQLPTSLMYFNIGGDILFNSFYEKNSFYFGAGVSYGEVSFKTITKKGTSSSTYFKADSRFKGIGAFCGLRIPRRHNSYLNLKLKYNKLFEKEKIDFKADNISLSAGIEF